MSKIGLIVSREFNQRVRKKSFILTTILTPLLLVGLMVAPALVMQLRSDQVKRIAWTAAESSATSCRATGRRFSYRLIGARNG